MQIQTHFNAFMTCKSGSTALLFIHTTHYKEFQKASEHETLTKAKKYNTLSKCICDKFCNHQKMFHKKLQNKSAMI